MGYRNTVTLLVVLAVTFSQSSGLQNFLTSNDAEYQQTRRALIENIASTKAFNTFNPGNCSLNSALVNEIRSYGDAVNQIITASMVGPFAGKTYNNLSNFVDAFGGRIQGSDNLEDAIDDLKRTMIRYGFQNVHTEDVNAGPAWKRGLEVANLLTPKNKEFHIVGLGASAPTPPLGILAEVVVFDSYTELVANLKTIRNKIVVCNYGGPANDPLSTVNTGYVESVTAGAKALLYKSATTFSLHSPHARRANLYYDGVTKEVPIAYMTVEDTQYLSRVKARGQKMSLYLNMQNSNETRTSRNLFGDLPGREKPDELVLIAAHTDAWDIGQGAQDDGVGVHLPLQAIPLLKSLNLIPRRTLRTALWTAEEYGYLGSQSYIQKHQSEFDKLSVAMESDYGCLLATGLIFNGRYELGCVMYEIIQLLKGVSYGLVVQSNSQRSDLDNFQDAGIPIVSLNGDDGRYFWFHHSEADTMTAVNSATLDTCLATWTATAYILADLQEMVPRGFDPIG